MESATPVLTPDRPSNGRPTVWGLTPSQIHDRFWAARGVYVVRRDEPSELPEEAGFYLLTEQRILVNFDLRQIVRVFDWIRMRALIFRLNGQMNDVYREHAIEDEAQGFVRFQRVYRDPDPRETRLILTRDRSVAELWQASRDPQASWQLMHRFISSDSQAADGVSGRIYHSDSDSEVMDLIRALTRVWRRPDATVRRARQLGPGIWADSGVALPAGARTVGPLWIGRGRSVEDGSSAVGPAVMWDDPDAPAGDDPVNWTDVQPGLERSGSRPEKIRPRGYRGKRLLDIGISLVAIALTLPLYPLIMLAIFIEDGWPFFFSHRRETTGGRDFPCVKFRSMRRDAEEIKKKLMDSNQSDGPQFYMEKDPRILRIGHILRKTKLDEVPQFFNVLLGQMSVIGPRPSPLAENQYCPPWREARLSVRPGITGLWQVRRTRREGLDFQEWVQYDLEYVKHMSLRTDLWLLWQTVFVVVRGRY